MSGPPSWAARVLAVIALLFFMQAAKAVLVPVALAGVMAFTLAAPVRRLQEWGIARHIGAALVLGALVALIVSTCVLLARPAMDWGERAPNTLHQLVDSIDRMRAAVPLLAPPKPLPGRARLAPVEDPLKERLASESVAFTGVVLTHVGAFVISAAATLILVYLLLIYERWVVNHLIAALPKRRQRALVLGGMREARREIGHFLSTMSLVNVGLGVATGIAMALIGLPSPVLWGAVAGVLNFIPYFGPLATTVLLLMAGVTNFVDLFDMLLPAGAYMVVAAIESNLASPWLIGRRLHMSQLAIFFSVLVFGWVWGVMGAFLAVPALIFARSILRRRRHRLLCALLARNGKSPPSLRRLLEREEQQQEERLNVALRQQGKH